MYDVFAALLAWNHVKTADVSRATGISPTVFSEWKKGKSRPKLDKLQKIAAYFDVSIAFLTGEEAAGSEELPDARCLLLARELEQSPALFQLVTELRSFHEEDLNRLRRIAAALKQEKKSPEDV